MTEPSQIRVSDDEREQVATEIREHFAAGRLTEDELSDRVQAVYHAKTEAELRTVRADLPPLPASPARQREELAQRRAHLQRRLIQQTGGAVVPFVICTVIWLAAGAQGQFWPIWVALVAVVALVRSGWRLYGPAPELDRVEHELARRESREQLRARGRAAGLDRAEHELARHESREQRRERRRAQRS